MKKAIVRIIAAVLMIVTLCPTAFAWTSNPVNMQDVAVDIGASSWAASELTAAHEAGLVPTLTGNPGYQDTITREQFAELVVQTVTVICTAPESAPAGTFTDTENTAILRAFEAGIVNGVGDGKFAPKQATNREQIAVMIARAIDYIELQTGVDLAPAASDISRFSDKDDVSSWAVDGVGLLASNGIMTGTSATTLSPKASCTVEQSILLLYRMYSAFGAN